MNKETSFGILFNVCIYFSLSDEFPSLRIPLVVKLSSNTRECWWRWLFLPSSRLQSWKPLWQVSCGFPCLLWQPVGDTATISRRKINHLKERIPIHSCRRIKWKASFRYLLESGSRKKKQYIQDFIYLIENKHLNVEPFNSVLLVKFKYWLKYSKINLEHPV